MEFAQQLGKLGPSTLLEDYVRADVTALWRSLRVAKKYMPGSLPFAVLCMRNVHRMDAFTDCRYLSIWRFGPR